MTFSWKKRRTKENIPSKLDGPYLAQLVSPCYDLFSSPFILPAQMGCFLSNKVLATMIDSSNHNTVRFSSELCKQCKIAHASNEY